MTIQEQINEIKKNAYKINVPSLLFEMNRKYRELKQIQQQEN